MAGRGSDELAEKCPAEGDALRQTGTRFTSADALSDTKTPGSGLFASSLALSPRLCCQTGE